MRITKLFFLLLLFCSACSNKAKVPKQDIAFERMKWDAKDDDNKNYTYRKQMVNDLLKNHTWAGLKKDSVVRMLGEPDVIEEDIFMLYHYEQRYLFSFVMSTQSVVIQLEPDSTVKLARTN